MIHTDNLRSLIGPYAIGGEDAVDPSVVRAARRVRRRLSNELRPLDAAAARGRLPDSDYLISRKFDGEFDLLVVAHGTAFLVNPGGTVRVGLPLLTAALDVLGDRQPVAFAGELIALPADGGRERVQGVVRVARAPRDASELERLAFRAFDLVDLAAADLSDEPLAARWASITELLPEEGLIAHVGATWGRVGDVYGAVSTWIDSDRTEGVVVRSELAGGFKIKSRHSIDAVVIGYSQGADDRADLLHDLLVAVQRPDGDFHVVARVGGGFTDDERGALPEVLARLECDSSYIATSTDNAAYRMVKPEIVLEFSALDLITETTSGLPVERMVVTFDAEASRWSPVVRMPLASVISPQFVRIRHDKAVHPADIGIDQLSRLVVIERMDEAASRLQLPHSTVLRRDVWTKSARGGVMVRKLMAWETNKGAHAAYPEFVVYGTDFSPNRKEPLQRDIRVTDDVDQAHRLYDDLRDTYVKRGWELVSTPPSSSLATPPEGDLPF